MNNQAPVQFRPPTPDDVQFIISSWLKSSRNNDFTNYISNEIYFKYMEHLVKTVINRSMVSMVCNPKDSKQVYGYVVYEFIGDIFVLNFIYIKYTFRNLKISESLLKAVYPKFGEEDCFITFIDRTMTRIVYGDKPEIKRSSWFIKNREKYKLNYNPFILVR